MAAAGGGSTGAAKRVGGSIRSALIFSVSHSNLRMSRSPLGSRTELFKVRRLTWRPNSTSISCRKLRADGALPAMPCRTGPREGCSPQLPRRASVRWQACSDRCQVKEPNAVAALPPQLPHKPVRRAWPARQRHAGKRSSSLHALCKLSSETGVAKLHAPISSFTLNIDIAVLSRFM